VTKGTPSARLESIDGLRGWAAIMVVLSHLWGQFAKHTVAAYDHLLLRMISDSRIAVLIFFVLSGVALILRFVQRRKPLSLIRLVCARYLRLVVPIVITILIVYLLIILHLADSAEAALSAKSETFRGLRHGVPTSLAGTFVFSFYTVISDYDPKMSFNSSLWTMPVEFKGSLLIIGMLFILS
jgi:peptidoglycan/LPS O-acetylase OafA/YrhL